MEVGMARISFSAVGNSPLQRLLGHNPRIKEKWLRLQKEIVKEGHLSESLKEEVRRVLAHDHGYELGMARGLPSEEHNDPKVKMAVELARQVAYDHRTINDDNFLELSEHFSEPEIAELFAFICFISATQTFGAMMNLGAHSVQPEGSDEKDVAVEIHSHGAVQQRRNNTTAALVTEEVL
ncbi:hypothetical protein BGC07_07080 [Piscirickettsia litoralis]|uniref:Carboxymuconolactone decarboxylase-like domain-containing protein n=2 Tax=Piscirickettsia litoralis TaxID=1891921 RepID=A0ABX3A261_9GAMM|nr:hypothetical protein BGC07_07080 [Piscirickettsia litoralis]